MIKILQTAETLGTSKEMSNPMFQKRSNERLSFRKISLPFFTIILGIILCSIPFLSRASHGQSPVSDIDHLGMGTFSGNYTQSTTDHVWLVFNANAGDVINVNLNTAYQSLFWLYQSNTGCIQVGNSAANSCMTAKQQNGPSNISSYNINITSTGQYAIQADSYVGQSGSYTIILSGSTATSSLCIPTAPTFTTVPSNITANSISGTSSVVNYDVVASSGVLSYSLSGATVRTGSGTGNGTFFNVGVTNVSVTTNSCGTTATTNFSVTVYPPATALNFDGQNDFVTIPHSADLNSVNLTVEAWIKTSNQSASNGSTNFSRGIVNKYFSASGNGYNVFIDGGKVYAWYFGVTSNVFDSNNNFSSTTNVADNNWHRVTFTVDNSGGKIYIDGVLESSRGWSGAPSVASTTQPLSIGIYPTSTNLIPLNQTIFDGSIDEVRIWNRSLCLGEIQNNIRELSLPQTGLLAYYKLNQGFVNANNLSITTLTDLSGNNRTGTLSGFALSGLTSNWVAGTVTGISSTFISPIVTSSNNGPVNTGSTINLAATGTGTFSWTGPNGFSSMLQNPIITNATSINAGTYTVIFTNAQGCLATATTSVVVNSLPAGALNFDGLNDKVGIPTLIANSQNFTVEGWVKFSGTNYGAIYSETTPGDNNPMFSMIANSNGTGFEIVLRNGSQIGLVVGTTIGKLTLNEWTHVAFARTSATTAQLYINGNKTDDFTFNNPNFIAVSKGNIGVRERAYEDGFFKGSIDELRIWTRALCGGELVNNLNGEISLQQNGLAAYYKFNQGFVNANNSTVTTLTDLSGNNRTGTLSGFALTGLTSNWVAGTVTGTSLAFSIPTPTISANGPTTFCPSGSVTLTASSGVSYLWSNGATTSSINVTSTGSYSVTVTNSQGCSATANATSVVVQDLVNPTITLNGAATVQHAAFTLYTDLGAVATDNCSATLATTGVVNANIPATYTLTYTATDASGNSTTATRTIIVQDVIAPIVKTKNITAQLNASGNVTITPQQVDNGSSDNSGTVTLSLDKTTFTCSDIINIVANCPIDANYVSNPTNANSGPNGQTFIALSSGSLEKIDVISANPIQIRLREYVSDNLIDAFTGSILAISNSADGFNTYPGFTSFHFPNPPQIQAGTKYIFEIVGIGIAYHKIPGAYADGTAVSSTNIGFTRDIPFKTFVCPSSNEVTLTATDASGNSSTASAIVTVVDQIAPTIVSKPISVTLTANGTVSITPQQVLQSGTDNCSGTITYTLNKSVFGAQDAINSPVTVQLTGTDASGNATTVPVQVTVIDPVPVVITQNITIQLGPNGQANITPSQVDNGSSSVVGLALEGGLALSKSTFDCTNLGTNTVTLTATSSLGSTASATAVVTVEDNIAPSALTKNITVQLDAAGNASITATDVNNGSTDNCSIATLTVSASTFTGANLGPNTVTLTVTDVSGNVSTATALVIVEDKISPVITSTQANVIVPIDAVNSPVILVNYAGNATATDNSTSPSNIVITQTPVAGVILVQNVPLTVTLTATDASGNFATQTFSVTALDQTAPIVITQNITVNLSAAGNATITAAQVDNGSTDNVGIASITLDKTSFSCANVGDNVVKLTVTDASGNAAFATATVTVKDVTAPTITAPSSLTVNTDLNNCSAVVNYVTPTAADNCSVVTSANVVHVLNRGQQFFDFANNRFEAQNSPGLPLTFMPTDGQKMAVFLQNSGSTHYLYQNVSLPASGPILLTYDLKYTNHAGGFSTNQFIAVQIRNASTNALLRTVFTTSPGSPAVTPMTSYSFNISEFAGQNVRLQLVDATINSFFFDVLLDNVKITGSNLVNGSFESDYTAWTAFSSNSASGTWGIGYGPGTTMVQTAGLPSGSVFPIGLTLNTFKATDASGNVSNASFTVTVEDNQLPSVIVQNRTIQLNGLGNATITAADINNGSTDNCGIATIVLSKTSFDCTNVGANTVTLTVTDVNGNLSTATAVVTVEDNIAPIVFTQNRTIQLNATGNATITAAEINNGSTDNCSIASIALSKTAFDCTNVGANTVTLTLTDVNGNVSTATAVVTVEDNIAPIVFTQNRTIQLNATGNATITAAEINNGSTDNCSIASIALSKTSFDCTNVGANTVTLTVTDVNGNVSTATAIVTVEDNIAPIVIVQNRTIQLNATGNATITAADINNGSTDNCSIASIALSKTSFDCTNVGANTVTLTVTDVNGNVSTATAVVTVEDNTAPIVITRNRTIQLNATGNATITAADINNGSTDNCSIASIALSKTAFDCSNVGANTVTLTVTDVNGNVSTATAVVTVEDKIAPIVITQNLTIPLSGGTATITAAQLNNGSTDNCGIASMTIDKTSFDCGKIGNHTVTLIVTDIHGNVASKTATVTIVGELTSSSIASIPTSSTFTGGVSTNLYLGYGAQSTTLQVSNMVVGGNGTNPRFYTYSWTGLASSQLSSTTSGSPVFTPTAGGYYTFNVLVTNKYGCTTSATISICVKDIREVDKKGKYTGKVFICHAPPGNPSNNNTLSISVNAVASHLSQHSEDRLGSCSDAPCAAPSNMMMSNNSTDGAATKEGKIELSLQNTELVAYPNPFSQNTTVSFKLPYTEEVAVLEMYDMRGVKIQSLFNGPANANQTYEVKFNGQEISAGSYTFRLITSKEVKIFKVVMNTN
jgi:hypothetical protein